MSEARTHHLAPLDYLYDDVKDNTTFLSRAGIVDLLDIGSNNDSDSELPLGICHIANFNLFSFTHPEYGRLRLRPPFEDEIVQTWTSVQLAVDMLNKGDGSVVAEVEGLPDKCPIRFTAEAFDTSGIATIAASQTQEVLARDHKRGEREICAFIGASLSSSTIPMAILTGLAERPQLSPYAVSSQLDNRQTFPFFGRLIPSELGMTVPLILYLKERNIDHLGVVHTRDDYGTAFARSLLQTATELHPDLTTVAVDLPISGVATAEDFDNAAETLAKTQYRWFLQLLGDGYPGFMEAAVDKGIAGTGKHHWLLNSAGFATFLTSLSLERDSPLARATRGVGVFSAQNGRPGMPVFDAFAERLRGLDNPIDIAILNDRMPKYPDKPHYTPPNVTSVTFQQDPSVMASTYFDETIMLGLTACKAAAHSPDNITVDGATMFRNILETSFEGATGNVTLDPATGSRRPETATFRITNILEDEEGGNETHIAFTAQDSDIFLNGGWIQENPYVYNDGTTNIPADLPAFDVNYNYIGTSLRAIGLFMASLILLSSVAFAAWTHFNRNVRTVRASQPIFLLILTAGTFILGSAIIFLSIDDEIASEQVCTAACNVVPWLTCLGFALIFAALFSKLWRVNQLFSHPDMRRIKLTAKDAMPPLLMLILANLIVLSTWTAVAPLVWEREVIAEDVFGRPIESQGFCQSEEMTPFVVVLAIINLGALGLASLQAYRARGIATEFAESDFIGKAIACMLLVASVGIPTIIIVSDEPKAQFFALSSIIFALCAAVLLFIFIPKMMAARQKQETSLRESIQQSTRFFRPPRDGSNTRSSDEASSEEGIKILHSPGDLDSMSQEIKRLREENEAYERQVRDLKAAKANGVNEINSACSAESLSSRETSRLREQNEEYKKEVEELKALLQGKEKRPTENLGTIQ